MSEKLCIGVAICFLLATSGLALFSLQTGNEASQTLIDGGKYIAGETAMISQSYNCKYDWILTDLVTSCGCLNIEINGQPPNFPMSFQSGNTYSFQAKIATAGRVGRQKYLLNLLGDQDDQPIEKRFVFELHIDPGWIVEPAVLTLNGSRPGQTVRERVLLYSTSESGLVTVEDVIASDDNRISVALKSPDHIMPLTKKLGNSDLTMVVRHIVEIEYVMPNTLQYDDIVFLSRGSSVSTRLPIHVSLGNESCQLKPKRLFLDRNRINGGQYKSVWLTHSPGASPRVISQPTGIAVELLPEIKSGGEQRTTKILVGADGNLGSIEDGMIELQCGNESIELEIRFIDDGSRSDRD